MLQFIVLSFVNLFFLMIFGKISSLSLIRYFYDLVLHCSILQLLNLLIRLFNYLLLIKLYFTFLYVYVILFTDSFSDFGQTVNCLKLRLSGHYFLHFAEVFLSSFLLGLYYFESPFLSSFYWNLCLWFGSWIPSLVNSNIFCVGISSLGDITSLWFQTILRPPYLPPTTFWLSLIERCIQRCFGR